MRYQLFILGLFILNYLFINFKVYDQNLCKIIIIALLKVKKSFIICKLFILGVGVEFPGRG